MYFNMVVSVVSWVIYGTDAEGYSAYIEARNLGHYQHNGTKVVATISRGRRLYYGPFRSIRSVIGYAILKYIQIRKVPPSGSQQRGQASRVYFNMVRENRRKVTGETRCFGRTRARFILVDLGQSTPY